VNATCNFNTGMIHIFVGFNNVRVCLSTGESTHFFPSTGGPFSRWYHSSGALRGKKQSRRDDLQSLAYSLVYFFLGDEFVDWREGLRRPESADVARHYRYRLPDWLLRFITYATDLQWSDAPDYDGLLVSMRRRTTSHGTLSATEFFAHATLRHFKKLAARC